MFKGLILDTTTYSNLLQRITTTISENNLNVSFHGGNSMYNSAGQTARDFLEEQQGWSINDGGLLVDSNNPPPDITVDITIGYSKHLEGGNNDAAIALVNSIVETANQAFQNSRTGVQLQVKELVKMKMGSKVTVKEAFRGLSDATSDSREYDSTNPYHVIYDRWINSDSDLLALLTNSHRSYCGRAITRGKHIKRAEAEKHFKTTYSVSSASCARLHYTFIHEVGHNFGCAHNKEDTSEDLLDLFNPYAFGFRDINQNFRTIMSYNCDDGSCPRILYFSDPAKKHQDTKMGDVNEMNNARNIREAVRIIKDYGNFHNTSNGQQTGE